MFPRRSRLVRVSAKVYLIVADDEQELRVQKGMRKMPDRTFDEFPLSDEFRSLRFANVFALKKACRAAFPYLFRKPGAALDPLEALARGPQRSVVTSLRAPRRWT